MFIRRENDISNSDLKADKATKFFQEIGLIKGDQKIVNIAPTTSRFEIPGKDYGEGWHRGGSESFIQVLSATTDAGTERSILRKAHHSMGGNETAVHKALFEAELLDRLNTTTDMAPAVRAVLGSVIYRDVVIPDQKPPLDASKQAKDLIQTLDDLGYKPLTKNNLEYVFENGRIKLIDGGPGDISKIR